MRAWIALRHAWVALRYGDWSFHRFPTAQLSLMAFMPYDGWHFGLRVAYWSVACWYPWFNGDRLADRSWP